MQDQIKFLMAYMPENQIKYPISIETNAEGSSKKIRDRKRGPVDPSTFFSGHFEYVAGYWMN
jgi:hypothetical protein